MQTHLVWDIQNPSSTNVVRSSSTCKALVPARFRFIGWTPIWLQGIIDSQSRSLARSKSKSQAICPTSGPPLSKRASIAFLLSSVKAVSTGVPLDTRKRLLLRGEDCTTTGGRNMQLGQGCGRNEHACSATARLRAPSWQCALQLQFPPSTPASSFRHPSGKTLQHTKRNCKQMGPTSPGQNDSL